jgi:hypothetical protein
MRWWAYSSPCSGFLRQSSSSSLVFFFFGFSTFSNHSLSVTWRGSGREVMGSYWMMSWQEFMEISFSIPYLFSCDLIHDDISPTQFVIPGLTRNPVPFWIPAFAGMTLFAGINVAVLSLKTPSPLTGEGEGGGENNAQFFREDHWRSSEK